MYVVLKTDRTQRIGQAFAAPLRFENDKSGRRVVRIPKHPCPSGRVTHCHWLQFGDFRASIVNAPGALSDLTIQGG